MTDEALCPDGDPSQVATIIQASPILPGARQIQTQQVAATVGHNLILRALG
jgi:hypothetical protein